ncbi:MAG: molybdenum cofactor guanylyltransferase [Desulfobacter sp.]|nr:molybdenum cofactor guanylyltransferase [Desulfobacter sp.]WDP87352.1 MAG: molybdenum cofactor guanylyltransferase [Desulfobacter sp.]
MEKIDCTGVILAGGKNSRLPGKKKAFHQVGETIILDKIYSLFSKLFSQVILVVNDPKEFASMDALVVTDIIPAGCALAGLHTGLFYSASPWIYATACDVPFISETVIQYLLSQRTSKKEIIIPRTREGLEPLSALYHKSCLPRMETNLSRQRFMIKKCFTPKKVLEVLPETLETLDPKMRFKFNVNTPEDLALARTMAGESS